MALPEYIVIVRHGSRFMSIGHPRDTHPLKNRDPSLETPETSSDEIKASGRPYTRRMAQWLSESFEARNVSVVGAITSTECHAVETARAYLKVLSPKASLPLEKMSELSIRGFWNRKRAAQRQLKKSILKLADCIAENASGDDAIVGGRAVLVVGHQPHLSILARLLQRSLFAVTLPLGASECVCYRRAWPKQLKRFTPWFAVGRPNGALNEELIDKIGRKMDTAKFCAGFASLTLGVLLSALAKDETLLPRLSWAVLFILCAISMLLGSVVAYDRLLLPAELWPGRLPTRQRLERPPTPVHWLLARSMRMYWWVVVVPGMMMFLVGVSSLAAPLLKLPAVPSWAILAVPLAILSVLCILRPRFGGDD